MKIRTAVAAALLGLLAGRMAAAAPREIVLERLSGSVAYATPSAGRSTPVIGSQLLPPQYYALTDVRSMAALRLPDSSVVSIGEASRVRVGSFLMSSILTQMRIAIMNGALHFSVRHPMGAQASYVFTTPAAEIAIRGTEGMIAVRGNETIVACVHGTNTDTLVTAADGTRHFLPPGHTLRVSVGPQKRVRMSMASGIRAQGFDQFMPIVARNHQMRAASQH